MRPYNATNRQVGKTPIRAIRIPSDTWERAKQKASEDGRNISDIVREYLEQYIEKAPE